jgi:hypothetical protein
MTISGTGSGAGGDDAAAIAVLSVGAALSETALSDAAGLPAAVSGAALGSAAGGAASGAGVGAGGRSTFSNQRWLQRAHWTVRPANPIFCGSTA